MKSNEHTAKKRGRPGDGLSLVVLVLAMVAIVLVRPGLSARLAKLKVKADDYLLPDPNVTLVASLGYRSAMADFIFGHVLVSHGLHFQEHRLFEHVGDYIDAINTLDPKFRDPYRFADTLLTLQPQTPPIALYRKARQIQERGMKELPYDQELWSLAGQYMAYLAPSSLPDPAEQEDFRQAGTRCLLHACELIGSDENVPFHCITATRLLSDQGKGEAAKHFLERLLVMSDNPELRALANRYLTALAGEQEKARSVRHDKLMRDSVAKDGLMFAPRVEIDALGPGWDSATCAAALAPAKTGCATTWRQFVAQAETDNVDAPATP